jgi:hypothetical protein
VFETIEHLNVCFGVFITDIIFILFGLRRYNGHNFHIWKIKMGFALCKKLFMRVFQQSLLQLWWKFKKETLVQKGGKNVLA